MVHVFTSTRVTIKFGNITSGSRIVLNRARATNTSSGVRWRSSPVHKYVVNVISDTFLRLISKFWRCVKIFGQILKKFCSILKIHN